MNVIKRNPTCKAVFNFVFLSIVLQSPVNANPTGSNIQSGDVTIQGENTSNLSINQMSEKAIINWQDFSVGAGESVSIQQPSPSATILNRVTGSQISNIQGSLEANGTVLLVNQNGVVFGADAIVNVNSLIATTSNIQDQDYLNNTFSFSGGGQGDIVNDGRITIAQNGLLALVGRRVTNRGTIVATLGRVSLASGSTFTVDLFGDGLVNFAVGDATTGGLVEHLGMISADGGFVELNASTAKNMVDNAINMDGVISAKGASQRGGKIVLYGGEGNVNISGELDVTNEAGQGGLIGVSGNSIVLSSGAKLLADGANGGDVLLGEIIGGSKNIGRANSVTLNAGSVVKADSVGAGNGGQIVIRSTENTTMSGSLSAQGGASGGNGGLIEVSSDGAISIEGSGVVDAIQGTNGSFRREEGSVNLDNISVTNSNPGSSSKESSDFLAEKNVNRVEESYSGISGKVTGSQRSDPTPIARRETNQPNQETVQNQNSDNSGPDLTLDRGDGDVPLDKTAVAGVQKDKPSVNDNNKSTVSETNSPGLETNNESLIVAVNDGDNVTEVNTTQVTTSEVNTSQVNTPEVNTIQVNTPEVVTAANATKVKRQKTNSGKSKVTQVNSNDLVSKTDGISSESTNDSKNKLATTTKNDQSVSNSELNLKDEGQSALQLSDELQKLGVYNFPRNCSEIASVWIQNPGVEVTTISDEFAADRPVPTQDLISLLQGCKLISSSKN